MNNGSLFRLTLAFCAFLAILGCQSPPPAPVIIREPLPDSLIPFTVSLMRQLQRGNVDIKSLQFVLSGRVALERENITPIANLEEGGRASYKVEYVKNNITINDKSEGELLRPPRDIDTGIIELIVCFEEDENLWLRFMSRRDETDSNFYLAFFPPDRNASVDEKGTLEYGGGQRYKLKYLGERPPYLMIRMTQSEQERTISREAPGRRVRKD